ncbi:hypothetical protein ACVWXO_006179 [Bradyrhizobium sp. LM2.7]
MPVKPLPVEVKVPMVAIDGWRQTEGARSAPRRGRHAVEGSQGATFLSVARNDGEAGRGSKVETGCHGHNSEAKRKRRRLRSDKPNRGRHGHVSITDAYDATAIEVPRHQTTDLADRHDLGTLRVCIAFTALKGSRRAGWPGLGVVDHSRPKNDYPAARAGLPNPTARHCRFKGMQTILVFYNQTTFNVDATFPDSNDRWPSSWSGCADTSPTGLGLADDCLGAIARAERHISYPMDRASYFWLAGPSKLGKLPRPCRT